jgi:hypothetical protein
MTSKPIVTMISSVKLNHPITMADVPTPDKTLPLPKSCAMMLAATDAVCCQRTDTSTKMEAMKIMAKAIWLTGRLGKGLTSRSDPSLSSSSCHPGNVARSSRQMKAKMVAMILEHLLVGLGMLVTRKRRLHEVGEYNHILELAGKPDEVQWILVYRDLVGKRSCIVAANPRAAICVHTNTEIAHSRL